MAKCERPVGGRRVQIPVGTCQERTLSCLLHARVHTLVALLILQRPIQA